MQKVTSIIIPLYNRETLISETIESVLTQTYSNWELIIIDDGSTDKSIEVVEDFVQKDDRIKLFNREREPKGQSACRNIGVEKSSGEYLIFLDSDDLMADFCIERRIKYMMENPELDFAVFDLEMFLEKPGDLRTRFNKNPKKRDDYLSMFFRFDVPWQTSCPIWQRSSFLTLNGFAEDMLVAEDPELHTRALLDSNLKFKVYNNIPPDIFYRYANFDKEKSDSFIKNSIQGRITYIEKVYNFIFSIKPEKKLLKKYIKQLGRGYKQIVHGYIFSTKYLFNNEFNLLSNFCLQKKIINKVEYNYSKFVLYLWQKDFQILNYFRIKGIFTRIYKIWL